MRARIITMVVLAASLIAATTVWAQSDGSASFGGGFWNQTNPEAKYLEYRDIPRGGFLTDYVLRQFSGKWAGVVWGNTPTRNDQQDALYFARGISWRLDAQFNAMPHLFSNVARSPWAQTNTGVFTLPDTLQRQVQNASSAVQNADLNDLLRSAAGQDLAIQTDVSKARLRARPMKDWQFEVKGSDRERRGSQAYGTPFGFTAIELPIPVDQRTLDLDATGTYTHGPARIMLTAGMSSFHNRIEAIRFDNFKVFNTTYNSRTAVGQQATAPDNNVARARIVGSVQLPYASTLTATIGVSQTTQTQDFLPMTVNPVITAISGDSLKLARGNLDGKVTDIVQDYRITGRPFAPFYGTLRFHQDKSDDKTPSLGMPYGFVNYDQSWTRSAVTTESTPYTHTVFGFDGDYSLIKQLDLTVLAERRTRELPDWREVAKDAENVFGAHLRARPVENVEATVGWQQGQRRMDSFNLDAYDGAEWPLFRRYDVADRDQTKYDASLSWSPIPKLDLSANGWWSKDDYLNSTYGMKASDNTQLFGEATVHAMPNLDVSGGFGYGLLKGTQASIEDPNAPPLSDTISVAPWQANLDDKNAYAFARTDWWSKARKVSVTAEYTFMRDYQSYDFAHYIKPSAAGIIPANVAATTAIDLPSTLYRTNDAALTATWHYSPQVDLGATYGYTQYDVHDPLYQTVPYVNVNPTNTNSAATGIFLGNNRLSYTAHRLQVRATRHF